MNDLNKIYEKFGNKICLSPFLNAFYQTNRVSGNDNGEISNTIVPCCVIEWPLNSNIPNIIDNSIKSTINTPAWKTLRKELINGNLENIESCRICARAEQLGGSSPRAGANLHLTQHLKNIDIIAEIEKVIADDYNVKEIYSLDWFPSNYCNYSCVMCAGGASSGRVTYEIKINKQRRKIFINAVNPDFYEVLNKVEMVKFTGGETFMQPQVYDLLQYMVENNIASNKTLFFLTNASSGPEELLELYSHFRKIIYMCSIDGVGDVIEYQRRGAVWSDVEKNSLTLFRHPNISTVCNFVLTAMNALNVVDFVKWLDFNQIKNGVSVSAVYREDHLNVSAMPDQLKQLAIDRLRNVYDLYPNYHSFMNAVLSNLEGTQYDPAHHQKFCRQIKNEDTASKKSFCSVVPEWTEYWLTKDK